MNSIVLSTTVNPERSEVLSIFFESLVFIVLYRDGTLWYYQCKGVQEGEKCTFNVRQKPPNSVLDVLRFIKLGELPRIVSLPS